MGTRISEAACIIMSHAVRASLGAGGREGAYSAEAAKALSPSHLTQHTQRLPFQSYARDSPCSGAGSGPPCCGSCWTSRPSQTPIPSPFPRPRHSSSVANTYHSLCCRNFSAITLWEAKQRGHCYPRHRGLWTGKASSSSQELPSRSLASRAPRSTTVGHAPACRAIL